MRKILLLLLLAVSALALGCSSTNDTPQANLNTNPTATFVLNSTLLKTEVPANVVNFRLTGRDAANNILFGSNGQPVVVAKAPRLEFQVDVRVTQITIELLDANNNVVGIQTFAVTLFPGLFFERTLDFVDVTVVTVQSIAVTPANPTIGVGATQAFVATATLSDGTTQQLGAGTTWTSGSPGVATVDANGLATGVAAGTSQITASFQGVSGSTNLTVTNVPTSLAITSQPTNGQVGVNLNNVTVEIRDQNNQLLPTNTPVTVALAGGTNPGGGTLTGTTQVNAVNGVATFTGLQVTQPGTGYTLVFSATGFPNAVSTAFNVRPATGTVTTFAVPGAGSQPADITRGPDDNMWFTQSGSGQIGRITTAGVVTEFAASGAGAQPATITSGPDGNLWFTERVAQNIGRMTTAGVFTGFAIAAPPLFSLPAGITRGPDGNLWFANSSTALPGPPSDSIQPISTAGAFGAAVPVIGFTGAATPSDLVTGPDNNLWVTLFATSSIARVTTAGVSTEFPSGANPLGITVGPDGALWYALSDPVPGPDPDTDGIERITTAGVVTQFLGPAGTQGGIDVVTGPDGNLWATFTATPGGTPGVARVTPAGVYTFFALPAGSLPTGIAVGPDNGLWIALRGTDQIARVEP